MVNCQLLIMVNQHRRLQAVCRRFKFEAMKAIGFLWLIDRTPHLKIKEPWNKMYKREVGQRR